MGEAVYLCVHLSVPIPPRRRTKMSSMNVVLRIQLRLDSKWAKTDLQKVLEPDGVYQLWNEMVKDGEITGSFSDGILNAAGITARKGKSNFFKFQINERWVVYIVNATIFVTRAQVKTDTTTVGCER